MDVLSIISLVKWGGILLTGLALFFHVKNSGRNEQLLKDDKDAKELQKKIDDTPVGNPDATDDSLRRGDF